MVAASVGVVAYGAVEAANPSVTRFEVASPQLPPQFDGLRVALVTDLHAGAVRSASFTRQVVDLVNAEHPDLVVVAGDLVDGDAARYSPEIAPLADLEAPLGVYATTGNHEMFRDTANWVTAFEDVGLTMLQNSAVPLERDGATITLAGVHDLTGEGQWAPDYDAALDGTDAGAFTLFTAHQPLQALDVEGRGVDVQVSGHTHGGQMWPINYLVPLQQPMLEGKATVGDTTVVTSRGAGAWGPAIRVAAAAGGPDHHAAAVMSAPGGRRRRRRAGPPGLGVGRPDAARVLRHRVGHAGARRARPVRAALARGVPVGTVLGDDPAQAPGVPVGVRRVRPRGRRPVRRRPTSSG